MDSDPLSGVGFGDFVTEAPVGERCGEIISYRGYTHRCTRTPHPIEWPHVASDEGYVVAIGGKGVGGLNAEAAHAFNLGASYTPAEGDNSHSVPLVRIAGAEVRVHVDSVFQGLIVVVDVGRADPLLKRRDGTVRINFQLNGAIVVADPESQI